MNRGHAIGIGIGLLAGAAIGGAIALLYAPQSAKETKQLIRDKTRETGDHIRDFAIETTDRVREGAYEVSRRGQAVVHAMKG